MKHHPTIGVARHAAIIAMLAAACATVAAHAQAQTQTSVREGETLPRTGTHADDIGEATHAWFDLQRSNAAAAPALPMPGAQATLAYERYLNSFETKIPASFGSALSGGNGALRVDYTNAGVGDAQPAGAN